MIKINYKSMTPGRAKTIINNVTNDIRIPHKPII